MGQLTVIMVTGADAAVVIDDDAVTTPEEAIEAAHEQFEQPTLCHQCTHGFGLGDWDVSEVVSGDDVLYDADEDRANSIRRNEVERLRASLAGTAPAEVLAVLDARIEELGGILR